jgi:hypothetical protein
MGLLVLPDENFIGVSLCSVARLHVPQQRAEDLLGILQPQLQALLVCNHPTACLCDPQRKVVTFENLISTRSNKSKVGQRLTRLLDRCQIKAGERGHTL